VSTVQTVSLLDRIRSRGYWRVVIRPAVFIEKRIPNILNLFPLVEKRSVGLRGWGYPHVSSQVQPHIDVDWVGQEFDWNHYLEFWRIYQSGQFVHFFGMTQDWRDRSKYWPPKEGWQHGSLLDPTSTVYSLTEIFEFATRLSLSEAGDDQMHVQVAIRGLLGRVLQDFNGHRQIIHPQAASASEFSYSIDLSRTDLIAEPNKPALDAAQDLFRRFGWDPPRGLLRELQETIGR
jgi:hypothetical protein